MDQVSDVTEVIELTGEELKQVGGGMLPGPLQ